MRISLAPSVTLVTVSVIEVKVWPASIVEAVDAAEDVGRRAALGEGRVHRRRDQGRLVVDRGDVARVTSLSVEVPPSPSLTVNRTVRAPVLGVVRVGVLVGDLPDQRGDRGRRRVDGVEGDDQIGAAGAAGEGADRVAVDS